MPSVGSTPFPTGSGECTITSGIAFPLCLASGPDSAFGCFALDELVPFSVSAGCQQPISVTFLSCSRETTANSIGSAGLIEELFQEIETVEETGSGNYYTQNGVEPIIVEDSTTVQGSSAATAAGAYPHGYTTVAQGYGSGGGEKFVFEDSNGEIKVTDKFGSVEIVEDSGRVEDVEGTYLLMEDSGGYVELGISTTPQGDESDVQDALVAQPSSVRGGRRHRHGHRDDSIADASRRALMRHRERPPTAAPVAANVEAFIGNNTEILESKGKKKSGSSKSKSESKSKKTSKSKAKRGKRRKSRKKNSTSKSRDRPTPAPTPFPSVDRATLMPLNNPTFIPIEGEPTSSPINQPVFPLQRSIDLSVGNCQESCISQGDTLCVNAFASSDLVVVRLAYRVSDANGVSADLVAAVTIRDRAECVFPASTCTVDPTLATGTTASTESPPATTAGATATPTPAPTAEPTETTGTTTTNTGTSSAESGRLPGRRRRRPTG